MIDLHTHSVHSDGILTVGELIDIAIKNETKILSITDHDNINALNNYQNKKLPGDFLLIPGVEFSTETDFLERKTKIHLLGYGYQIDDKGIAEVLKHLYKRRSDDNKEYIEGLIKKFSFLSHEVFIDFDYGKYGWIHKLILKWISDYYSSEQLAILKDYLMDNKPTYHNYNERVEDMISLIHMSRGYAVFAHPQQCDVSKEELSDLVDYLSSLGLDGIETYHAESETGMRKTFHELALKYDLYETGGSDFHNFEDGYQVGDVRINYPEEYEPLLVRRLVKEKKVLGGISEK